MIEPNPNSPHDNEAIQTAAKLFESALSKAASGSPPPRIDDFVDKLPDALREACAMRLREIEQSFQQAGNGSSAKTLGGGNTVVMPADDGKAASGNGDSGKTLGVGNTVVIPSDTPAESDDRGNSGKTLGVGNTVVIPGEADKTSSGDTKAPSSDTTKGPESAAQPESKTAPDVDATIDPNSPPDGIDATIDPEEPFQLNATIDPEKAPFGIDATIDPSNSLGDIAATIDPDIDAEGVTQVLKPGQRSHADDHSFSWNPNADNYDVEEMEGAPKVPGYWILKELGRGGMGVVYKARHRALKRDVALKMILSGGHASADQLARFRAEAEAVAAMQHVNIVQIYDVGDQDGLPFFSLEFVDGGPLDEKLDNKPQTEKYAAEMVETLARAMHFAHEKGIVHRDLKPANVLVANDGTPKITDFGLVKRIEGEEESTKTREGTIMGTPSYMAPEQGRGEIDMVGPPADIYALGSMLYAMLVGRPPFLAATPVATLMQLLNEEPVPPSKLTPKMSRDLETICLKCIQKDIPRRYETAELLADDLRRFLDGEPILGRPVGRVERAWRWCKKNPRVAALSGIVMLLVLVAGIALTMVSLKMARERQTVQRAREQVQERIDNSLEAIGEGKLAQASATLATAAPLLQSTPELSDEREQYLKIREQLELAEKFKTLFDDARYYGLFGDNGTLPQAKEFCEEVFDLYRDLKAGNGKASCGLPTWGTRQEQLFKQDLFDVYLVASQVETNLANRSGDEAKKKAAIKQCLTWLDEADQIIPDTRVSYLRRAKLLSQLGDEAGAEAATQKGQEIEATSDVDRFWRAVMMHQRGNAARRAGDKAARAYLLEAVRLHAELLLVRPDHFWAYYDWSSCQAQLNFSNNALIGFSACVNLKPDLAWPYFNRGTTHLKQGSFEKARQDFARALERNPKFADALFNRAIANVREAKDKLASDETKDAGKRLQDLALRDIEQAIELRQDNYLYFYQKGEIYLSRSDFDKAIDAYTKALELNPAHLGSRTSRGAAHFSAEQYEKAIEDFSVLIKSRPNSPIPYFRRATSNMYLKRLDDALADWKKFAEIQKGNHQPLYYMAMVHRARRQFDEALKKVEQAAKLAPHAHGPQLLKAQVFYQQGKLQEALELRQDVLEIFVKLDDPAKAGVYNDIGDTYFALNDLPEAAKAYRKSLELHPKQTDGYIGLANVLIKQNNPDEATACYDEMVAATPEKSSVYLHRARHRRNHDRTDDALADVEKAKETDDSEVPDLVAASIRAKAGEHAQAAETVKEIVKSISQADATARLEAATVLSLAASVATETGDDTLAETYAEEAERLLLEALEKSLLEFSYQQGNRIIADPALSFLKARPALADILKTPAPAQADPDAEKDE